MPDVDHYAELNAAITGEMGAPIVTRWMVLGELIDEDGDRRVFYITSDGCSQWDELGLMDYHRAYRHNDINPTP